MQHWWVNQNQTYVHEVGGGYLWSPKVNSNGGRNRFYDAMTETQVGDVVFSFCDTLIKAIGMVSGRCQSAPKPTEFGATGEYWAGEGWYVPVLFTELKNPIKPKDFMTEIAPTLPSKYSPLQRGGNGNQGVYLAPVPDDMAAVLRGLLRGQVEAVVSAAHVAVDDADDREQQRIAEDTTVTTTEREQLIRARVGQGLFRSRVELLEPCCRVTGVSDRRFLRASHIKPWARSTNPEKLDGANGLLLAPHIDHLFDKGFISFNDDGSLLLSPHLPPGVVESWSMAVPAVVKVLTPQQQGYMGHHRAEVFMR